MGLTAILSSASSSAGAGVSATVTSLLSPVGLGVGGVFVAGLLVYLLAYLDLLDSSSLDDKELRLTVVGTAIPLGMAFLGTVLFKSLQIV